MAVASFCSSMDETYGLDADDSQQWWWSCNYETKGDNPHLSSTGFAASAHGWWLDHSDGDCPEYADVEVWLQAKLCYYIDSEPQYCWWDTVDRNEERIRAGGGSGRRTTARHDCVSNQTVAYRSIVDVDLVGTWDGPGVWISIAVDVDCYPTT